MSGISRQATRLPRRHGLGLAGALALLALGACDKVLEVDLPDAVTSDAFSAGTADVEVNSVIALIECAYSALAIDAAGYEDNFQRGNGNAPAYSEYEVEPGGNCEADTYESGWDGNLFLARKAGYELYDKLMNLTNEQVEAADGLGSYPSIEALRATTAIYSAVVLNVWGDYYCEATIDAGPLMTPSQTLDLADQWATDALGHVATGGDFGLTLARGTITTSMQVLAYGIRARVRWAKGDLAGAAADAAQVPDNFFAWVLREDGVEVERVNLVSSMQGNGGGVQAAGLLQGPVTLRTPSNSYGISFIGTNPVTGLPWPDPIPFTGYLDLGIVAADGRAISDNQNPITTAAPGTVADPRVPFVIGNTTLGPFPVIQKYTDLGDDIPLLNWAEMRLIRAEAEGGAAAIAHVNAVRNGDAISEGNIIGLNLPAVTYVNAGDPDGIEDMIIEERRRALWLEGRFWETKILNTDKLWFPRNQGQWINLVQFPLAGGVRVLLPNNEYELNENLSLADRGTGCDVNQRPIFN